MEILLVRIGIFIVGLWLVIVAMASAVRSLVLPRSAPDAISRFVFISLRRIFALRLRQTTSFLEIDQVMAFYAPISLLALLPVWLIIALLGYTLMFWSLGEISWYQALRSSGSSLLTLGFTAPDGWHRTLLEFSASTLGLILVALLIAYLPTMYAAFSRRENNVTLLEVRAGDPPWAVTMLERYQRIHGLDKLGDQWQAWETWFAEIEESHTSLPALVFFRSPQPNHSWVTSAGAVLDAAALYLSSLELPTEPRAALCIRAGYLALRRIADFFAIRYNNNPHYPADPITITRTEFEDALNQLAASDALVKTDRDQAWLDFAGWRVNYDLVLVNLARLTMAPAAPWTGSRGKAVAPMSLFSQPK